MKRRSSASIAAFGSQEIRWQGTYQKMNLLA